VGWGRGERKDFYFIFPIERVLNHLRLFVSSSLEARKNWVHGTYLSIVLIDKINK
jgi:hypothetical protein